MKPTKAGDIPLGKVWGEGNFRAAGIFFSLSNSLYEFFLGHSMNIFKDSLARMNFFFI